MSKTGECIRYLGYSETPCPECGRYRLEMWSDGSYVCEKCNWSTEEARYIMPWEEMDGD